MSVPPSSSGNGNTTPANLSPTSNRSLSPTSHQDSSIHRIAQSVLGTHFYSRDSLSIEGASGGIPSSPSLRRSPVETSDVSSQDSNSASEEQLSSPPMKIRPLRITVDPWTQVPLNEIEASVFMTFLSPPNSPSSPEASAASNFLAAQSKAIAVAAVQTAMHYIPTNIPSVTRETIIQQSLKATKEVVISCVKSAISSGTTEEGLSRCALEVAWEIGAQLSSRAYSWITSRASQIAQTSVNQAINDLETHAVTSITNWTDPRNVLERLRPSQPIVIPKSSSPPKPLRPQTLQLPADVRSTMEPLETSPTQDVAVELNALHISQEESSPTSSSSALVTSNSTTPTAVETSPSLPLIQQPDSISNLTARLVAISAPTPPSSIIPSSSNRKVSKSTHLKIKIPEPSQHIDLSQKIPSPFEISPSSFPSSFHDRHLPTNEQDSFLSQMHSSYLGAPLTSYNQEYHAYSPRRGCDRQTPYSASGHHGYSSPFHRNTAQHHPLRSSLAGPSLHQPSYMIWDQNQFSSFMQTASSSFQQQIQALQQQSSQSMALLEQMHQQQSALFQQQNTMLSSMALGPVADNQWISSIHEDPILRNRREAEIRFSFASPDNRNPQSPPLPQQINPFSSHHGIPYSQQQSPPHSRDHDFHRHSHQHHLHSSHHDSRTRSSGRGHDLIDYAEERRSHGNSRGRRRSFHNNEEYGHIGNIHPHPYGHERGGASHTERSRTDKQHPPEDFGYPLSESFEPSINLQRPCQPLQQPNTQFSERTEGNSREDGGAAQQLNFFHRSLSQRNPPQRSDSTSSKDEHLPPFSKAS